ncbi:MAG TPA: hypothetical protein VE074_08245 [Jatrophihabitantaceae bacterium]|nr:hypothetical protein [Jatrophihabitantaceae bacterium]
MPNGREESSRSYAVSANYQESWVRKARICLLIAAVLIVLGVVGVAAGAVGAGLVALLVGVVVGGMGLLIRRGIASTRRYGYALAVASDQLTVTWRDQVTELPWADLDRGLVVTNGPLMRTLEVTPRPGVRYVLPRNARPRRSKQRPDNLDVFILSILDEKQAECLADISEHLPVQ